ncbi:hypothetical protein ACWGCW_00930 [Streptomyces sp. NPDC054933]
MLDLVCYLSAFVLLILAAIPGVPHRDTLLAAGLAAFVFPTFVHALQTH